ncbi:hypothetical protein SLEP1_g56578 [Rubroshorea leprosula]|uniref:Uncharacterized protein n=1 Tax=Rubroshorea leprosula TaxID=152421 RepID=A0AAV5MIQ9_9ROSI|nr:hypothetical protein SLEP1_g56578 [Rubroshorea leprosula]
MILKFRFLLHDDVQDGVLRQPSLNLQARKEPKASSMEISIFCSCHFLVIDCWIPTSTEKMGTSLFLDLE